MIFKYNYINDDAEKLQELVRHIIVDIWCNAKDPFSIDMIDDTISSCIFETDYNIREKINRTSTKLKKPIEEIYNICLGLNTAQKNYIRDAFEKNNKIEEICDNTITPVFYDNLQNNTSIEFANKVNSFFKILYEEVFGQKPYYINKHYDNFMQHNEHLCPICGLNTLEADSSNHRDDYDHYLPKEKYPFNTVNLKNLMPICSDCNKKWKKNKNPVQDKGVATEAFYYYGSDNPDIEIKIQINDIDNCNINIILTSHTMQNKVDTWDRIYLVSRRYKEHVICHKRIGKGWLREAKANFDRGSIHNIDKYIDDAKNNRLENKNFIKAPFLEECKNKGLLFNEKDSLLRISRGEL